MQQYFGKKKENNIIYLQEYDLNHIKNVMRMKENDNVLIAFEGIIYNCSLNKDFLSVSIIDVFKENTNKASIVAYIPVLSDDKMSLMIQKGTELGITCFIPVVFSHCKFKLNNEAKIKKVIRWGKIAKEASEQTRRVDIPEISDIISLKEIEAKFCVNILCTLDKENVKHISEVLNKNNVHDTISMLFGPEGGLTTDEEKFLSSIGFTKTSLGENVLRSETVIIYLTSIINYLRGE